MVYEFINFSTNGKSSAIKRVVWCGIRIKKNGSGIAEDGDF